VVPGGTPVLKQPKGSWSHIEAAIEKMHNEIWKPGRTLPKLRRAIALILQELKR
jgi:hypothetical protein